jgi:hypothetical protein
MKPTKTKEYKKYTGKNGRPTKYDVAMIDKADEYLDTCKDKEEMVVKSQSNSGTSYERVIRVNLPSHEGFADYLDVATSSLYLWAEKYSDFSEALERIKRKQLLALAKGGLSGDYNSTIAKLILSSNHGMTERKDLTSKGDKLNNADVIDDINKNLNG